MKSLSRRRQFQSPEPLDAGQTCRRVVVVKSREEIRLHLGKPTRISNVRSEERGYSQSPFTVIDHFQLPILLDGEYDPIGIWTKINAIVPVPGAGIRKMQQRFR